MTNATNALASIEAGADYLGLNFHPPSPRSILVDSARSLTDLLDLARVELVGLFVDCPIAAIASILHRVPAIQTIQLHGSESVATLEACRDLSGQPRIIRAFRLRDADDIAAMTAYLADAADRDVSPDAILVDALVAGHWGGTGHAIPLELLSELPGHPRLILAGGLTPANVADRVARVRPWMVDVASGVESSPGWKDPALVAAFVRAARAEE